eukprot:3550579-Rhodomonas_salina.3
MECKYKLVRGGIVLKVLQRYHLSTSQKILSPTSKGCIPPPSTLGVHVLFFFLSSPRIAALQDV